MTAIKRPIAAAGAAVLLALSLTACGGGAPTDASVADFCAATSGTTNDEEFTQAFADEDWEKITDLLKEQVDKIEEVGTPESISDEEREGFEIQVDAAKDLNAKDLEKAFTDQEDPFEADLSDDEKDKVEAYNAYESETCADAESE